MYLVSEFQFLVSLLCYIACMVCMEGYLPGGTRPNTPHHHMGLWLQATVQMRLCRGCAQGGVWWKRVGGRAGARQGRTAQNSGRMFVFAATLVPRRRDLRHGNVGERENFNPRNHRDRNKRRLTPPAAESRARGYVYGVKSLFLRAAVLSRLPDPVLAVRLQNCKVSTFGRALHHLAGPSAGSVQQRAGQPRARMSGSFLRSQSCDIAAAATGLIAIRNTRDGLLAPQSSSLLT